jgi:hypothetical protein
MWFDPAYLLSGSTQKDMMFTVCSHFAIGESRSAPYIR